MKALPYVWLGFCVLGSPLFAAGLDCIQGSITPEAVTQWRREAALALEQNEMSDPAVGDRIKACFGTRIPACMQRLADYAMRNEVGSPAADVPVRSSPQKQPPQELFLSGSAAFEYRIPSDIEARAAALNWPHIRYKSRHSGGFDADTPSLLMILVPGDRVNPPVDYDRWLNIALPADPDSHALDPIPGAALPDADDYAAEGRGEQKLPRVFTMVSLDRRVGNQPARVYFQKFRRGERGDPAFRPEGNANPESCVSCHPNGLRAISPLGYHVRKDEASMSDADWQTVSMINEAMLLGAGNRVVSWRDVPSPTVAGGRQSLLNPAAHGPSIGPLKPLNGRSRTAAFIAQCSHQRTVIEVKDIFGRAPGRNNVYRLSAAPVIDANKVIRAMNCSVCHGTTQRAPLNALTDWQQIDFKILVDQSMPLGAHRDPAESGTGAVEDTLTGDERIALANCLKAEFALERQELDNWLTQGQCQ